MSFQLILLIMFTQDNKRLLPLQFTVHRRGNDDTSIRWV